MNILIDAFGGDNAPLEVLKGAAAAVAEYGVTVTAVGDEAAIHRCAEQNNISLSGIKVVHAVGEIPVEADPTKILKEYSGCSMAVGLKILSEGGADAFVSAGSTGALVVAASLVVKRIRGIKRAAIGAVIPTVNSKYLLLDGGANAECRPEMLLQFAIMGSAYMEAVLGVKNPRVGLVNIGSEANKGTDLQYDAYRLIERAPVNFIGNVEPRDIPYGACDVAVADGFTGNVVLKLTEGVGMSMAREIKQMFLQSTGTKVAALLMKNQLKTFKAKMDYSEHGGAPLMGISRPVIKAHGSSKAKAFKNAIRQARDYANGDVIGRIQTAMAEINTRTQDEAAVAASRSTGEV